MHSSLLTKRIKLSCLIAASVFSFGFSSALFSEEDSVSKEIEPRVWISIGADAAEFVQKKHSDKIQFLAIKSDISKELKIVSIPEKQIDSLSKLMHDNFHRCGGFFFHETKEEAEAFSRKIFTTSEKSARQQNYTIDNASTVNALVAQMNAQNMQATVDGMSNYYNRYYANQTGVDASNWLMQHWQTIASNRSDISVELFDHSWAQPSVIATIRGTSNPEEIIVIGGHLDSINGGNPVNGRAPGSDDNASGIAVVTETLSAIVASDYRPARTIKLMGYAAEEVGLRGSQAIANLHRQNGQNVLGVAQFDMTGFKGSRLADIVFISDYTNSEQTQFMADLLDTYFPTTEYQYSNCGYACSDHASWTAAGFAASFPFEAHFNDSNSRIHTSVDNTFDVAHATHFLQLSLAYVAELAKGQIGTSQNATLQFNLQDIEVNSGQTATISVSRTGDLSSAVAIDFTSENGTAVAGTDYTSVSGTLSWDIQENSDKQIQISTNSTSIDKKLRIILSNPQGGAETGPNSIIEVTLKAQVESITNPPVQSSGGGSIGLNILLILGLAILKRKGLRTQSR